MAMTVSKSWLFSVASFVFAVSIAIPMCCYAADYSFLDDMDVTALSELRTEVDTRLASAVDTWDLLQATTGVHAEDGRVMAEGLSFQAPVDMAYDLSGSGSSCDQWTTSDGFSVFQVFGDKSGENSSSSRMTLEEFESTCTDGLQNILNTAFGDGEILYEYVNVSENGISYYRGGGVSTNNFVFSMVVVQNPNGRDLYASYLGIRGLYDAEPIMDAFVESLSFAPDDWLSICEHKQQTRPARESASSSSSSVRSSSSSKRAPKTTGVPDSSLTIDGKTVYTYADGTVEWTDGYGTVYQDVDGDGTYDYASSDSGASWSAV